MITPQTWRVAVGGGGTAEVTVTLEGHHWVATYQSDEGLVRGRACGWERAAVARLAGDLHWSVVEIRGPGELTTAEAVAAETARCAALCDKLQETVHPHFAPWAACRDCAKAIRRDPSLPPDFVGCRTPTTCLAPDGHTPLCMECRDDGDDSDESEVPQ